MAQIRRYPPHFRMIRATTRISSMRTRGNGGGRGFPGIKGLRGEKRVSCQFQRLLYQDLQLVMFRGQVCGEEKALLSFGKTYEKSRLPRAPAAIKN